MVHNATKLHIWTLNYHTHVFGLVSGPNLFFLCIVYLMIRGVKNYFIVKTASLVKIQKKRCKKCKTTLISSFAFLCKNQGWKKPFSFLLQRPTTKICLTILQILSEIERNKCSQRTGNGFYGKGPDKSTKYSRCSKCSFF